MHAVVFSITLVEFFDQREASELLKILVIVFGDDAADHLQVKATWQHAQDLNHLVCALGLVF